MTGFELRSRSVCYVRFVNSSVTTDSIILPCIMNYSTQWMTSYAIWGHWTDTILSKKNLKKCQRLISVQNCSLGERKQKTRKTASSIFWEQTLQKRKENNAQAYGWTDVKKWWIESGRNRVPQEESRDEQRKGFLNYNTWTCWRCFAALVVVVVVRWEVRCSIFSLYLSFSLSRELSIMRKWWSLCLKIYCPNLWRENNLK